MKKMILLALMSVMVSAVQAQVVYGAKQGWEAGTTEDEYTGQKSH